ncbi:MAG: yusV 2 [Firmicutes bacterium]|nr:yusV 2 [Bacillota bacterium]
MISLLEAQALSVGYEKKTILENINFTINTGDFISVIAPNGAGKSTLLKTIAGVLAPIDGNVNINKKPLTSYSRRELAQQIAMVGADTMALGYTVQQMVLMGRFPHIRRFHGPSNKDHVLVKAAIEAVDISNKSMCFYSELSQGERQKVIIARALVQQPQLLLLDEPTAHLDIANQFNILRLIKKAVVPKKVAVIAVLHDINLALEFSTKLLLIKNSRVLAFGEPQAVVTIDNLKQLYGLDFTLYHDAAATYVRPKFGE